MQGGRCMSESLYNMVELNQHSVLSTSNVNHSTAWWNNLMSLDRQAAGKSSLVTQDLGYGDDLTMGKDQLASISAFSTRDTVDSYKPEQSGVHVERGSNHGNNHVIKKVAKSSASGSDYCPWNTESCGTYMGSSEGRLHSASSNSASSNTSDYLINNGDNSGSSLVSLGKRKSPEGGHTQFYAGGGLPSHLQDGSDMQHTVSDSQIASGSITTAPSPREGALIGQQEQLNLGIGFKKRETCSEGSHKHLYAGGSSSSCLPAENIKQHTVPTSQDASERITTAASPVEWPFTSQLVQLDVRISIEESEPYSEFFPPPNITDIAENAAENVGQQEPNLFIFPFTDTGLRPSGSSSGNQPSGSFWSTDSSVTINLCNPSSQSHEIRVPENTGSITNSRRSGPLDPQSGCPLKSRRFSGSRSTASQDAHKSRTFLANHSDSPASDTSSGTRRLLQDSPALNIAFGNTRSSESSLPSSQSGSNSSMQNILIGGTSPEIWTGPNQQGIAQYSPQLPFHPPLPDHRSQRGHFPVITATPSSVTEGAIPPFSSQGLQNQSSRPALLIGEHTGPTSRQRGLAVEARQRLVRHVRNTSMQRGDSRRAENVTIGVAELHDRHRELRLDIDNMSYEELLALEERIGNVCTGLSDEVIMRSMKRRKHLPMRFASTSQPCCICQDEFVAGDEIGTTVCEHEFHFRCIKQWLSQKNLCPICKKTALNT